MIIHQQALRFFLTDIPGWIIRHRPHRTAPVKTVRPSLRYTTRSTADPGPPRTQHR